MVIWLGRGSCRGEHLVRHHPFSHPDGSSSGHFHPLVPESVSILPHLLITVPTLTLLIIAQTQGSTGLSHSLNKMQRWSLLDL